MDFCMITFRSVTPAQRGERLLRQAGFICNVQRTPRHMEVQGCGYSIRVAYRNIHACVRLLREHQVPFRKVYVLSETGVAEEMPV